MELVHAKNSSLKRNSTKSLRPPEELVQPKKCN
jgi:hypothetical protein